MKRLIGIGLVCGLIANVAFALPEFEDADCKFGPDCNDDCFQGAQVNDQTCPILGEDVRCRSYTDGSGQPINYKVCVTGNATAVGCKPVLKEDAWAHCSGMLKFLCGCVAPNEDCWCPCFGDPEAGFYGVPIGLTCVGN